MAEEISSDSVVKTPGEAEMEADDTSKIDIESPESLINDCSTRAFVKAPQEIVSRYLKPRFESCHDSCKYGERPEEKPWKATRRRFSLPNAPIEHDFVQFIASDDEKMKMDKNKVVMKKKLLSSEDPRKHIRDPKPYLNSKPTSLKPQMSKFDLSRPNASSGKKGSFVLRKNLSFDNKPRLPNPPVIGEVELVKLERPEKRDSSADAKSSRAVKKTGFFKSPAKSRQVKPKQQPLPSYSNSDTDGQIKAPAKKSLPKSPLTKRDIAEAKEGSSSSKGLLSNHTFDDEKLSDEKVLHVITVEAIKDVSQPSSSNGENLLSPQGKNGHDRTIINTEADGNIETMESAHRKSREGDTSSSCKKLKFKSGKTVEIDPGDNTPRRLRFRATRTLDEEDGKSNLRKKSFKRTESNGGNGATDAKPSSVVLKRQGIQGKKDAKGLLNSVIKETASKLVETRKSKVKALVGAFETVISLQESSKPSS